MVNDDKIIRLNMGTMSGDAVPGDERATLCLGIESSCDETSAAIVDSNRNILSHIIYSQIPEHQKYGGVVPELAARAHILAIDDVINKTLPKPAFKYASLLESLLDINEFKYSEYADILSFE